MRLLIVCLVLLTGCGGTTRIGFISNPGSASVNGVVSFVHISVTGNADGSSVTMTAVTLVDRGLVSNLTFCGDQHDQFPMNQSVTATFNPGTICSTLVSVKAP